MNEIKACMFARVFSLFLKKKKNFVVLVSLLLLKQLVHLLTEYYLNIFSVQILRVLMLIGIVIFIPKPIFIRGESRGKSDRCKLIIVMALLGGPGHALQKMF